MEFPASRNPRTSGPPTGLQKPEFGVRNLDYKAAGPGRGRSERFPQRLVGQKKAQSTPALLENHKRLRHPLSIQWVEDLPLASCR